MKSPNTVVFREKAKLYKKCRVSGERSLFLMAWKQG